MLKNEIKDRKVYSLSSTISKRNDFEVERKHNYNYYQNMRLQSRVLTLFGYLSL